MNFEKYCKLRELLERVSSESEFIEAINQAGEFYLIPTWKRDDYGRLYERVKGGHHYDTHFQHE